MDKAVNFILRTERFDGQFSFNPRLAFSYELAQSLRKTSRERRRAPQPGWPA